MKSREFKSTPYGDVDARISVRKLSEVCVEEDGIQTGPFGSQLHSSDYVEVGTPIITVEHLGENVIEGKAPPMVSAEDVKRLIRYTLQEGDIVFSRVGSVDRRALVSKAQNGWMFSGRLLRVRANPTLADPKYLSYFFGLPTFKTYIRSIAVGATMPSLNTGLLSQIPVILPEISKQRAIGSVLSALDEKIGLNYLISKTLEDIAQTIFKSWFIDFDPVKAKMAGEKPEGMDDATAALFPDSMEESELGLIPKGWEISSVGAFCPFKYGKALPASNRLPGTVPVYGSNGVVGNHNEALTSTPSIVIGRKGTVGTVNLEPAPCWIIDTAFYADTTEPKDIYLAYLQLKTLGLNELNSDGAVPGLNRDNAHRHIFTIGTYEMRDTFAEVAQNLFTKIAYCQAENSSLIGIRDSLLPRLISGELQIPEEMLAS